MRISITRARVLLERRRKLAPLLALLLLLALNADLAHSHDNDPNIQLDCEICLNLGQNDELAAGEKFVADPAPAAQSFLHTALMPRCIEILDARSRSPPLA